MHKRGTLSSKSWWPSCVALSQVSQSLNLTQQLAKSILTKPPKPLDIYLKSKLIIPHYHTVNTKLYKPELKWDFSSKTFRHSFQLIFWPEQLSQRNARNACGIRTFFGHFQGFWGGFRTIFGRLGLWAYLGVEKSRRVPGDEGQCPGFSRRGGHSTHTTHENRQALCTLTTRKNQRCHFILNEITENHENETFK